MKQKSFLKKKAVVASLFSIFIVCSVSVFVPYVHGSVSTDNNGGETFSIQSKECNIKDIYTKIKNQEDISYEEIFSSLEKELSKGKGRILLNRLYELDHDIEEQFGDKWPTIFQGVLKYFPDLMGSLDLTKPRAHAVLRNKIYLLCNQIKESVSKEKTTSEISSSVEILPERVRNMLYHPNDKICSLNKGESKSKYFEAYWKNYTRFRDRLKEFEHYDDWYDWASVHFTELIQETYVYLTLGAVLAMLGLAPGLFGSGAGLLSFLVTSVGLGRLVYFYYEFEIIRVDFDRLWTKQIDIVLHITDNTTGLGVDDLEIWAKNTDVPNWYNNSYGNWNTASKFNYSINQAYDKPESGWYALSSMPYWDKSQPPFPPGFWNITIPAQKGYSKCYIDTYEMQNCGIYINQHVTLQQTQEKPDICNENPEDGATGVELNPTLYVDVIDYQNDSMNVTFYVKYADGSWTEIKTYTNEKTGHFNATTTTVNEYGTSYYWMVEAIDQKGNHNSASYHFTTKPE